MIENRKIRIGDFTKGFYPTPSGNAGDTNTPYVTSYYAGGKNILF
jgi:hypothetical protein